MENQGWNKVPYFWGSPIEQHLPASSFWGDAMFKGHPRIRYFLLCHFWTLKSKILSPRQLHHVWGLAQSHSWLPFIEQMRSSSMSTCPLLKIYDLYHAIPFTTLPQTPHIAGLPPQRSAVDRSFWHLVFSVHSRKCSTSNPPNISLGYTSKLWPQIDDLFRAFCGRKPTCLGWCEILQHESCLDSHWMSLVTSYLFCSPLQITSHHSAYCNVIKAASHLRFHHVPQFQPLHCRALGEDDEDWR